MSSSSQNPALNQLLPPKGGPDISVALQAKVIRGLWNDQISTPFQPENYTAYFGYFKSECENWQASGPLEIVTYGDLLDLVQHLQDNRAETLTSSKLLSFFPIVVAQQTLRNGVCDVSKSVALRHTDCSKESVHNSLCLAVRLWLMVNVGSPANSVSQNGGRLNADWASDESLDEVISRTFPKDRSQTNPKRLRWPKSLNAWSLERVGGFEINWTSNLADHLCFDEDSERISLFHHGRFLQDSRDSSKTGHFLPEDLLQKTAQTLALLMPNKIKCRKWYRNVTRDTRQYGKLLDPAASHQRLWQRGYGVDEYHYWKERLEAIAKAFEDSEPKGLMQLLMDRRKPLQWLTFWIAVIVLILTVIFGLISCITGILQVYAAYNPRKFS